uniref:GDSL esterase/lipase At5g45960-like n=1 Tax=Erigeron canadensis TaxID=72917 RepID=UPI001CB88FFA|nr:GDSL esterase/lipase At5g45960-like [Erigeron canadensis]
MPTPLQGALTFLQQLDLFKDYKQKLDVAIGKEKTNDLITNASYLISSGTNDFTLNYYGPIPVRQLTYPNISGFQQFMWQNIQQFIQELMDEGAKKIGLVGVPPIGCLPAMITLHSKHPILNRECIENLNAISKMFNQMLQDNLDGLRRPDIKIMYLDIYTPILDMVEQKTSYGFEEVHKGCCGTGLIEAGFFCNSNSLICDDVSKYIFWDSFHPTEKAYRIIFDSLQSHLLENIL